MTKSDCWSFVIFKLLVTVKFATPCFLGALSLIETKKLSKASLFSDIGQGGMELSLLEVEVFMEKHSEK